MFTTGFASQGVHMRHICLILLAGIGVGRAARAALPAEVRAVVANHCLECHDAKVRKGGLDLESMPTDFSGASVLPARVSSSGSQARIPRPSRRAAITSPSVTLK